MEGAFNAIVQDMRFHLERLIFSHGGRVLRSPQPSLKFRSQSRLHSDFHFLLDFAFGKNLLVRLISQRGGVTWRKALAEG